MWNDKRFYKLAVTSVLKWTGMAAKALIFGGKKQDINPKDRKWWQKPGVSVMYQIESRPGWEWDRNFVEFNKSMTKENGKINFNGPYCNIKEWVDLSQKIGLDYHLFEIKWHDGICYYDTKTTNWIADKDYGKEFADLSRKAKIPFGYYYSSIFDHNPQFDDIQPVKEALPSIIGNKEEYKKYLVSHYDEIIDQYKPDSMWFDWWWDDGSTETTYKYYKEKHPEVAVTFNMSNLFPVSHDKIQITSGEAHRYDGPWVHIRKEASGGFPVFTSSRLWANAFRWIFNHEWEVCTPAGKWWQDPSLRDDPYELLRQTAVVLSCGGKLCIGATSLMDGHIFPDQLKQLNLLGEWYVPRKQYFTEAVAIPYRWFRPLSVNLKSRNYNAVASEYESGKLLHLINRTGKQESVSITLHGNMWSEYNKATIIPQNKEIALKRNGNSISLNISTSDIDIVDTILYFTK